MDAKALAKSKRAHSLHHSKKSHLRPKPKPATDRFSGAGGSKGTSEKPAQLRQPRATPALPSNRDRYGEELYSVAQAPGGEVPTQSSELPLPKSKGADYRHLVAEAKAQPPSHSDPYLDSFPSMDDVLPDFFNKGAGPLLSARGEAIVSMTKDDSFLVEDKATGRHEVSLLSLNLNVLAEQLVKVDLAKRLFIEEDLLPPELLREGLASSIDRELEQFQTGKTEAASKRLGDFNLKDFTEQETEEDKSIWGSRAKDPTFAVNRAAVDIRQLQSPKQSTSLESTEQYPAETVAELKCEPSTFKDAVAAAAAEAELDALLDSFNDTKLTDKSDFTTSRSAHKFEEKSSKASHQVSSKGWESAETLPAPNCANIDVLLDDLLEEASELTKQNGLLGAESSVPSASARSKVLDDFDSWLDTI